jgi:1-acyl-sn-glycerol-3-phosphate acyltransferase
MPDSPTLRRLITIPSVLVLFALLTASAPVVVPAAAGVDLVRWLGWRKPWMTVRALAFSWLYLLGESWALLAALITVPLPHPAKQGATFRLQKAWSGWNFWALRAIFSLDIEVEGQAGASSGPMLILSRHASIVDTLLPARLIANPYGMRLRYVLKRELLVDPILDIGGHRLPNHFIDRGSGEAAAELEALRNLARGLAPDEGVLIYPEGTRFSEEKRAVLTARAATQSGGTGALAAGLRRVLPPRPSGTLALLEASDADVVILAHHGLEGLATAREIWMGGLVGSKIRVAIWRVARDQIPQGRRERTDWLYRTWARVDEWVVAAAELG